MMSEEKKVTLAEHVADTHRDKERLGNVVTGDIVSGDVVDEEESTDASEDEKESGEGSDS
jgi:hypothetical protein